MKLSLRLRLVFYVAALVLAIGALVAGSLITSHKRRAWVQQVEWLQKESARISVEGRAAFWGLNSRLLRYRLTRAPADLAAYTEALGAFDRWLQERAAAQTVREGRDLLGQMRLEHRRYRTMSDQLLSNLPPVSPLGPTNIWLAQIEEETSRILDLDTRLNGVKQAAFASLVERLWQEAETQWKFIYASLALTILSLAVLAHFVYRDMIAPLRRTVIQSRAVMERQEKLSALGLLTAGLAHEIRNPLNSIRARLFTQRRLLDPDAPALDDNQFIEEEIDRLEGVVRNALQMARPSAPALQQMELPGGLEPIVELLRASLAPSRLVLQIESRMHGTVAADPNQVKQALLNLVRNAAESMGQDGTVTLRTRPWFLRRGWTKVPAVALEVQDTGPGITPEVRARLFDPFFTTKANGTGLGLSLSAQIVHAHGGLLECESEPGHGALFRIVLPLRGSHEKDPRPAD
jgi:signal transduction histidine kinase